MDADQRAKVVEICKYALQKADEWEYPGEPGAGVAESVLRAIGEPYVRHMRQHGGPPKVKKWKPEK